MKRKQTLLFLVVMLLLGLTQATFAQNHHEHEHNRCSNSQLKKYLDEQLKANPELKRKMEISKARSKQAVRGLKAERTTPYVIPVVFHIIHNYGVENISDAKVYEALEIINKDYSAQNEDLQNLKAEFKNIAGNCNIEFKLAQIDPDGNPTTGITRTVSSLTTNGSWDNPEVKRLCSWPREKYLNVWIVRSSDGNNGSAWAYLPYQVDNENMYDLDGIIISSWAFGATTEGYHRILTHEIGHFLNLYHTWSPWAECGSSGSCSEDDDVADTPNCTGYSGGCDIDHSSCGSLDMVQNYMDYSKCPVAFSKGQVARMHACLNSDVSDRNNLWSESNLNATLFSKPTPRILCKQGEILENKDNNGQFTETFAIELLDAEFNQVGQILSPSNYSFTGVPQGLTPEIHVTDATHLSIRLQGQTANHNVENNSDQLAFHFQNSILKPGSDPLFNQNVNLSVKFRAPYQIVYNNCDDIKISSSYTWEHVNLGPSNANFGVWYDNGKLRIETYEKPLICENSSRNITELGHGETIDASGNWVAGGAYPDEHDLVTTDYTTWQGKTAYVAIQFPGIKSDEILYGWMRLMVTEDGSSFTLMDYAYNEAPGAPILTGQKDASSVQPEILADHLSLRENYLLNDGSIEGSVEFTIMGDNEFAKIDVQTNSTDYVLENLPDGLSPELKVMSAKRAVLTLKGRASAHEKANSQAITLQFKNQAFANPEIENKSTELTISFYDAFRIVHNDIEDIVINPSYTWEWFSFNIGNAEFGAWHYTAEHLKLETYGKAAICQNGNRNIVPLNFNTKIDANNNWVIPGSYPDQLDIRTANYHAWEGKTAYIGVRFSINNYTNYGWIRVEVAQDGTSYKVLEWAYNQAPNQTIYTGQTNASTNNKLLVSSNKMEESWNNDGSFDAILNFELQGSSFTNVSQLEEGTHYQTQNLPNGLQCKILRTGSQQATLTLNGKASQHDVSNNISNFEIQFTDDAFTSPVSGIDGSRQTFSLLFRDPYQIKYVDCDDLMVNDTNPWISFALEGTQQQYGLWIDKGDLRFESYSKPIVCQQGTTHIIPLEDDIRIDSNTLYWEPGGDYPNEHYIVKEGYNQWLGKTACFGFAFQNKDYLMHYGWFRIQVAADGLSYKLLDYAYHEGPNLPVFAGSTSTIIDFLTPEFNANSTEIEQNQKVLFTDNSQSSQTITEWLWTFEGGTPASYNGQTPPEITYSEPGQYDVSLALTDAKGNSQNITKANCITVTPVSTPDYCIPEINALYSGLFIKKVELNGIANESGENGYSDFTNISFNLTPGSTASLQVTPSTNWSGNQITIWMDWNKDGSFDEDGEKVLHLYNGNWNTSHSIQVPSDATAGATRMRIRICYYNEKSPCEAETYMGEVEDYTVNISRLKSSELADQSLLTNQEITQFKVYPNPSSDFINVTAPLGATISIYSLQGRKVLQKTTDCITTPFSVHSFKKGIYLIRIETPDKIETKRVVVQ
ncbi:MAG: GEVED domain-containing protein [Marinifilaceae bacterium]